MCMLLGMQPKIMPHVGTREKAGERPDTLGRSSMNTTIDSTHATQLHLMIFNYQRFFKSAWLSVVKIAATLLFRLLIWVGRDLRKQAVPAPYCGDETRTHSERIRSRDLS